MHKTITAIIPAFNEGKNIRIVLLVLEKAQTLNIVNEVVVVDDGSEDNTSKEALRFNAKVLKLTENKGKARAMAEGLKVATGEICLFLDADLTNLKVEHMSSLIKSAQKNRECMSIAKFTNGRIGTDIAHTINTSCSGQRAAKTEIFKQIFKTIRRINKVKYGIEYVISSRIKDFNIEPLVVEWEGVSQIRKEEKWGFLKGSYLRIRMYISMNLGHLRNFFYRLFKMLNTKEVSD